MNRQEEKTIDCYSAGERAAMVRGQRLRAWFLRPALDRLIARGWRADHLTLASTLVGLAFCPMYLYGYRAAAFAALALHVILDGLDGPLARRAGTAGRRGSLTDSMADQVVIAATTLTLMIDHQIGVAAGACYVFFYTVVVLFAMARNALGIPYRWLVRPRFFVYAWAAVSVWWWPGTLEYVLWLSNALLAGQMLSGFVRLRRRL
ncbi:MAG TPA: CDP-alcohol phosphatidyltransferase family protein [Thermoguttaceae bacterium]|nr:CDP-alcohol phosphatidyltransferase family protein [Thermoguttaceae bacterium]